MNKVKATGILIGTGKDKNGHDEITVAVKRPGIDDTNIRFVLETEMELTTDITLGKPVKIEGYVKGFYLRDSEGKSKVTQYLVATKVTRAPGELEEVFHIWGHFKPKHEVRIYVEGTVSSVLDSTKNENTSWKSLLLTLDGVKENPDIIVVGFRENNRILDFYKIRRTDRIVACLSIRTSRKRIDGVDKYFENLVVDDLVITNRDINEEVPETDENNAEENISFELSDYVEEGDINYSKGRILIDADSCPVVDIVVRMARKYRMECTIICDTAHIIHREGAETITVDQGTDSVDFRLVNLVNKGDIVVTQDYGLAAMCLSRQARVVNQYGKRYSDENIEGMLEVRAMAAKIRRSGGRIKGPSKRTAEQDTYFEMSLEKMIRK